jgi:erythromycin esterase-like protein
LKVSASFLVDRVAAKAACAALSLLIVATFWSTADGVQTKQDAGRESSDTPTLIAKLRTAAHPLTQSPRDYDPLIALIGEARVVMLGEATHGSREFYRERARITSRLIEEKGFSAIVLEGDWPQMRRVNQYVQNAGMDASAEQALSGITRFPRWSWRNSDFRDFVEDLRIYNDRLPAVAARVGVFGMDLYSVSESAQNVIGYLEKTDPEATRKARLRYRCLSRFTEEIEFYGRDVIAGKARSCRNQARIQFSELQRRVAQFTSRAPLSPDAELFSALQDARVVKSGEAYFRALYSRKVSSWNIRDRHMAQTLIALMRYLDRFGEERSRVVVWAHNTHQGDARMTSQAAGRELNLGQLMRERYGKHAVLVGFSTHSGTVRAASEWKGKDEVKKVLPALPGSATDLFHQLGMPAFLLTFRGDKDLMRALARQRLDRVIGVVYLPEDERDSHYYRVRLSRQFDAFIHIDSSSATVPLE